MSFFISGRSLSSYAFGVSDNRGSAVEILEIFLFSSSLIFIFIKTASLTSERNLFSVPYSKDFGQMLVSASLSVRLSLHYSESTSIETFAICLSVVNSLFCNLEVVEFQVIGRVIINTGVRNSSDFRAELEVICRVIITESEIVVTMD